MDDKLKKFARLVEKKSFTQAAKDLHISQPALTLAINKLERELKTPLLLHRRQPLELTDAGQIVYDVAVEHRTADENLHTKLTELAGKRPEITIGMVDSVTAALNDVTESLDELEAKADVSIIVNDSRYLRAAVENREIDLAFTVQDNAIHPKLDIESIGSEPFVLVCRPDRLDDFQAAFKAKDLPDFISYDRHSTTYGHVHSGLHKLGINTRPVLYSTSYSIMLNTALHGRGIAALPRVLARDSLKSGRLAALSKGSVPLTIDCPLSIVKLRGKLLPKSLEIFSEQAKTTLSAVSLMKS